MNNIQNLLNLKQFKKALAESDRAIYLTAYEYAGRNQVQTAKLLGVSRGTLRTKLKSWDVPMKQDYTNRIINELFGACSE